MLATNRLFAVFTANKHLERSITHSADTRKNRLQLLKIYIWHTLWNVKYCVFGLNNFLSCARWHVSLNSLFLRHYFSNVFTMRKQLLRNVVMPRLNFLHTRSQSREKERKKVNSRMIDDVASCRLFRFFLFMCCKHHVMWKSR